MLFWSEEKQSWMWDRWECGNATPVRDFTAAHLHFRDGEPVREEDLPRMTPPSEEAT